MFHRDSLDEVAAVLDRMSVPLFVAERHSAEEPFTFVFVNAALETASGMSARDIVGLTPVDLLGERQGSEIALKWAICVRTRQAIGYTLRVDPPNGRQEWDTTLQHVPMPDGRDRVVGASTRITCRDGGSENVLCFDDIRYHAAIADIQLTNLAAVLEGTRAGCLDCGIRAENVDRVAGLCRSVRRAIADIRLAADRAYCRPEHDCASAARDLETAGCHLLRALSDD